MTRTTTDRELVFLGAVCALLLSLLAGVETAGLVGGLFATGHPVLLPLPSAATTLVRLAGHLGSSAWPPHDQPWLPETMAPALALGGLVALVLSNAAVLVLRRLAHTALGDGARFARAGDVRQLHARGGLANGSGTWTQARAIAAGLLQIGQEADRYDREPHWRRTAARYLAPLLLAANQTGQSMRTVVSWIDLFERDELRKILNASPDPEAIHALENLESLWKTDHRYQGSVIGTLSTALDAWQEPAVARATTLADISPRWLCDGSNTLYIVSPASQQRRLQNLFGGLLVHMIDGALEFAQQASRGRLDPPLLCALDEICNAAPLPTLGEYASSGAGQGVLLLSVIQDYSQAIDAWGRERAATIVSNHRGKLFWSGIADPATFEYIDRLLGQEERERESRTRQAYGGTSTTRAFEFRPLAPPHRLRQAKFGTALLVYGQLPPVWTEQRLFTEDPRLRQLVPEDAVQARNLGSGPRRRSALWRRVDGNVT
jgi:type IV secretory pathway TraG/TraD family ATPase VirD4